MVKISDSPVAAPVTMSDRDFQRFSDFIYQACGVKLPPSKKTMLTSRLAKRLRELGMDNYRTYFEFVSSSQGRSQELVPMIDVVTTNKTDFFREPKHFEYLFQHALPELAKLRRVGAGRKLNVWSAGCSSGEEPYTLSMVLAEYFSQSPGDFFIYATDISTRVLKVAQSGIYPEEAIQPIPESMKHKYLLRGKGAQEGFFRVVKELRKRIGFSRLNLNEGRQFELRTVMDVIFCRNVIIYFDRQTQIALFEKFYHQLVPGGYMYIGHSETLHGINNRFVPVATSVYRKPES